MKMGASEEQARIPSSWCFKPKFKTRDELLWSRKIEKNGSTSATHVPESSFPCRRPYSAPKISTQTSKNNGESIAPRTRSILLNERRVERIESGKTFSQSLPRNQKFVSPNVAEKIVDGISLNYKDHPNHSTRESLLRSRKEKDINSEQKSASRFREKQDFLNKKKLEELSQKKSCTPEHSNPGCSRKEMLETRKQNYIKEASKFQISKAPGIHSRSAAISSSATPWWKLEDGYVESAAETVLKNSIRIQKQKKNKDIENPPPKCFREKHEKQYRTKKLAGKVGSRHENTASYSSPSHENFAEKKSFSETRNVIAKDETEIKGRGYGKISKYTDIIIKFKDDTDFAVFDQEDSHIDPAFAEPFYSSFTADKIFHESMVAGYCGKRKKKKGYLDLDKSEKTTEMRYEEAVRLKETREMRKQAKLKKKSKVPKETVVNRSQKSNDPSTLNKSSINSCSELTTPTKPKNVPETIPHKTPAHGKIDTSKPTNSEERELQIRHNVQVSAFGVRTGGFLWTS